MTALTIFAGFALDALLGDPQGFPHIVRLMGRLIAALEKRLYRFGAKGGVLLVCAVIPICAGVPFAALAFAYRAGPVWGLLLESLLCWQLLAARSLKDESMKVCRALEAGDTEASREHVAMIVGRDTAELDAAGIARAAVETVAENASDGVIAPIFYIALGGAALGCLYKAVNTMDSMVGYKNEKYLRFGRAAAKTDDILNYPPSRAAAVLMILSAYLLRLDGKNALRVWRRDRRSHASPNSAQTEAVCAGALGIRLGGPASYSGKMHDKPYIGDGTRPLLAGDIATANRLMYCAGVLAAAVAMMIRIGVFQLVGI